MYNTVIMGHLPMYHIFGFMFCLWTMWYGCRLVIMQKFVPERFLQYLQDYRVQFLQLVPPIAQFLAKESIVDKYDLSSLRILSPGAAPLRAEIEEQLKKRFPNLLLVGQGYGMTEVGIASHLPAYSSKPGAGGLLNVNMDCKVINAETGRELGPHQVGEVCCRGPNLMKGYLNNPKATAETIDKDGWLHTGDIGYYDTDNNIYIVDRIKELIKVKGLQVAPAELEAILMSHDSVLDAAVIGVQNDRTGELPRAFVVLKPDHSATEQEIYDFVKDQVSPYKRLDGGILFVESIPKAPSGKILRRVLREQYKAKM